STFLTTSPLHSRFTRSEAAVPFTARNPPLRQSELIVRSLVLFPPNPAHNGRGQGLGREPRLPQGQGTRVSARIVDSATPRPPCARAGPGRGAQLPCQAGSGHVVQHTQWSGNKATQGALLPGTT